jgi:hypothetical protein
MQCLCDDGLAAVRSQNSPARWSSQLLGLTGCSLPDKPFASGRAVLQAAEESVFEATTLSPESLHSAKLKGLRNFVHSAIATPEVGRRIPIPDQRRQQSPVLTLFVPTNIMSKYSESI